MLQDKLKELGVVFTPDLQVGPTFLFPNGEFIATKTNYDNGLFWEIKSLRLFHLGIESFLYRNELVDFRIKNPLCHTDNVVRLQDSIYLQAQRFYVVLPPNPLTMAQYEKLEDWIYALPEDKRTLDVSNYNDAYYQVFDLKESEPKDIIKEIKRFYNNV